MAKFSELGINIDVVVGKGIEIEELFGKRILVEKAIIKPTNFPGKNSSGMRMQMQVCIPDWKEDGMYQIGSDKKPIGERRSCFTGSDILINSIKDATSSIPSINQERINNGLNPINLFPMETTIVKIGKCFQFT